MLGNEAEEVERQRLFAFEKSMASDLCFSVERF